MKNAKNNIGKIFIGKAVDRDGFVRHDNIKVQLIRIVEPFYIYKLLTPKELGSNRIVFGKFEIFGDDVLCLKDYDKDCDGYPLLALEDTSSDPGLIDYDYALHTAWIVRLIMNKQTPLVNFFKKLKNNRLGYSKTFMIDGDDIILFVTHGGFDGDTGGSYDYSNILDIIGDHSEFGGDFDYSSEGW